ncbi:tubulin-specific chaperone c [Lichtheimia corymbifera JMRC:FSU:9682]|uniref:Tubulin-specific chaperone c n=1 Tax=Lichtheimia corymbifera JMRC:FSU:9682 TaxID=1263082 RepID=A0A068RX25_9FUNG|nr:tubulin-specific chaperone c [Lichtheimia corymbifera JMRC:FSU:9682]
MSQTATEASNNFWQDFKAERQSIEDQIQQLGAKPKNDLPGCFDSILKQINQLEKTLTQALDFVPSYDERQYMEQLKVLSASLESAKANLTPKAKFSFKSRKTKKEASNNPGVQHNNKPTTTILDTNAPSARKDNVLSFKDKVDTVIRVENPTTTAVNVLLSKLRRCVVLVDNLNISSLHVEDLKECLIVCGMVQGSVLIYGISLSIIAVGCHQFRMHNAQGVDVIYNVSSRPIIEDSSNIRVTEYPAISVETTNYFDNVDDFNWLKQQASPNWKVMDSSKSNHINHQLSSITPENALSILSALLSEIKP